MATKTTTKTANQTPNLLTALAAATPEDLAEIRRQIETKAHELYSPKEVEKLLAAKFGETPLAKAHKAKRAKRAGSDETDDGSGGSELANQIFDTISKHGPLAGGELAEHLSVSVQAIGRSAHASGWFVQDHEKKWHIKKNGE